MKEKKLEEKYGLRVSRGKILALERGKCSDEEHRKNRGSWLRDAQKTSLGRKK